MTTDTREPPWVPGRRTLKAAQLAASLHRRGFTATDVGRFDVPQRRAEEKAAELARRASEETWRQALDMLAGSTHSHALCPFCGHGNPDGIEGPPQPFLHDGPCSK